MIGLVQTMTAILENRVKILNFCEPFSEGCRKLYSQGDVFCEVWLHNEKILEVPLPQWFIPFYVPIYVRSYLTE